MDQDQLIDERNYPSDVQIVNIDDREFIIIGTAHISQKSADLVRTVIEKEKPDSVCVELDERRYKALSSQRKWEALDLKSVIRQKQLSTLLINLLLASYQKKLGKKLGVVPGIELLEATQAAKENDIPIVLCDRDIRITLRRAWHSMSFWEKVKMMSSGLAGILDNQEISEEKLAEIREKDVLSELMSELGKVMPVLKTVLIDERDTYLTQKMRQTDGQKIVAVVGAGHVRGILEALDQDSDKNLEEIETIPPASSALKWVGWGIPAIIIGSILLIGWNDGFAEAEKNAIFWVLANGIPSAIGAIIAAAHPMTIIASFLAAPVTSLTPVIGAGYVAAFVQAYFNPPIVKDFQNVTEELSSVKNWWQNKLLKIILVFMLTSIGSLIGTWVGAYEIVGNVWQIVINFFSGIFS